MSRLHGRRCGSLPCWSCLWVDLKHVKTMFWATNVGKALTHIEKKKKGQDMTGKGSSSNRSIMVMPDPSARVGAALSCPLVCLENSYVYSVEGVPKIPRNTLGSLF